MTIPLDKTEFVQWSKPERPTIEKLTTALSDEGFAPRLLTDPAGDVYGPHQHETAQLLIVVSGSMELRLREETFTMQPGDRLYLAPRQEHAATVGPEGVGYFDVVRL